MMSVFPVIDLPATGANILRLRQTRGLSVRDLQRYFGFEEPQAIYKWQRGQSLPTVDNLYALSVLLEVPMNEILVPQKPCVYTEARSGRPKPAALVLYIGGARGWARPLVLGRGGHGGISKLLRPLSAGSGAAFPQDRSPGTGDLF